MPSKNGHHNHHAQQLRLKCLVLGSAGAGKTSILRRYNYGTFEGQRAGQQQSDDALTRSGKRNPTSTLGADYYVKKVDNPVFAKKRASSRNSRQTNNDRTSSCPTKVAESQPYLFVQLWDTAGKERLMPQRYPAQYDKKSNFYQFLSIRLSPTTSNSNNSNNYEHRYNNWGLILNGTINETNNSNETNVRHHDNEQK